MKKQIFLFLIIALGIIATAELLSIISTVNPMQTTQEVLWAFFISLFISSSSILSLLWHTVKKVFIYRNSTPWLWTSVRQASLLCLIVTLSLFFNSLGIFSFWEFIPLLISAILIEFFFQADKSPLDQPRYGTE